MTKKAIQKHYTNKTIWIIGASAGIGKALTEHLLSFNIKLIISARNVTALESIAQKAPEKTHVYPLDVSNISEFKTTFQTFSAAAYNEVWDSIASYNINNRCVCSVFGIFSTYKFRI